MTSRLMSPVDAAWYRMDRPNNPAVVTGLVRLGGPIDRETITTVFEERLLPFERFRCRVVERGWPWALPYWEEVPDFDVRDHIHDRTLAESGGKVDLLTLVGDLASEPLDPGRPLWDAFLIDEGTGDRSLVLRFHHCMADGTGAVALAQHLLDPVGTIPQPRTDEMVPSTVPTASSLVDRAAETIAAALRSGVDRVLHPLDTLQQLPRLGRALGTAVADVVQPPDAPSPLQGTLTGQRRLAYAGPVPLAAIKAVGAPVGATINDVLLAALTGAVRRYLLEQRPGERPVPLHAIVPVDLRPAGRGLELGNAFGLTFLALPVDEETPSARLHATKQKMDAIKRSPEAPVFLNILGLFGQLPRTTQDAAASLFASKATMVMTNVAGPTARRTLGGHPVEEIVFWVPHPVQLGVGVSLLSYADQATVGVETDTGVVSTPTILTDYILEEIEALQEWGRDVPKSAPMVENLEVQ